MAKANPKAYFPGYFTARIYYKKVGIWERRQAEYKPYFDTWDEAYSHLLSKAKDRLRKAEKELEAARRHWVKVGAMVEPPKNATARSALADKQEVRP